MNQNLINLLLFLVLTQFKIKVICFEGVLQSLDDLDEPSDGYDLQTDKQSTFVKKLYLSPYTPYPYPPYPPPYPYPLNPNLGIPNLIRNLFSGGIPLPTVIGNFGGGYVIIDIHMISNNFETISLSLVYYLLVFKWQSADGRVPLEWELHFK